MPVVLNVGGQEQANIRLPDQVGTVSRINRIAAGSGRMLLDLPRLPVTLEGFAEGPSGGRPFGAGGDDG